MSANGLSTEPRCDPGARRWRPGALADPPIRVPDAPRSRNPSCGLGTFRPQTTSRTCFAHPRPPWLSVPRPSIDLRAPGSLRPARRRRQRLARWVHSGVRGRDRSLIRTSTDHYKDHDVQARHERSRRAQRREGAQGRAGRQGGADGSRGWDWSLIGFPLAQNGAVGQEGRPGMDHRMESEKIKAAGMAAGGASRFSTEHSN